MRTGQPARSGTRSPGSRTRSVCTCQGLRPRRAVQALAISRLAVLPSVSGTASAPGMSALSRLDGWPMQSPADASPVPSRAPTHGSGPMWFATPSSQWTSATYSSPVSRRSPLSANNGLCLLNSALYRLTILFSEIVMAKKRRSQAGSAERRKLEFKELADEWDRRLAVLNMPDAHKRLDAVFAARGRMRRPPKAGPAY